MVNPIYVQRNFRVRDDSTALNTDGGYLSSENTDPVDPRGFGTAERFRLRFTVDETNNRVGTLSPTLFVSKEGAAYARVDATSSNVQATGGVPTDGAATSTQLLSDGVSGTFETDGSYDEGDGATPTWSHDKNGFAEFEFCVFIVEADVAEADTLDFRVRNSGSVLDTYAVTPRVIVTLDPFINDVETTEEFDDKQTLVTVAGFNFEAVQGTGKVEISDNATYGSGNVVLQTETSWGTNSIEITAVLGAMAPGTPRYLWVTNDTGNRNPLGFVVHVHRAHAFQMAASANIAAGGENTTRQLTIPAGKVAGDFDGGRISDDENPSSPAIDLTLAGFREDERCFQAVTDAEDAAQYEFRDTLDGRIADVISVTPKWTIGTAGKTATSAMTILIPTMTASGELGHFGTSAMTMLIPTMAATGVAAHHGTSAMTMLAPTMAATGVAAHQGTSAMTMLIPTMAATGALNAKIGTSAMTMLLPTMVAAGELGHFGTSAMVMLVPTMAATGLAVSGAVVVCTDGVWSTPISFLACDDFRITIDGPAADQVKISTTIELSE